MMPSQMNVNKSGANKHDNHLNDFRRPRRRMRRATETTVIGQLWTGGRLIQALVFVGLMLVAVVVVFR